MTSSPNTPPYLSIAVLTVSDTRTADNDKSGHYLAETLKYEGHCLREKIIIKDDRYLIRAKLSAWIADPKLHVILITGGTGFASRDVTPEAVKPLFDKEIPGFGELFRHLSYDEIGSSTLQSRALAGLANKTFIFCMPGSTSACQLAWEKIIQPQLDQSNKPCNIVDIMPYIKAEK